MSQVADPATGNDVISNQIISRIANFDGIITINTGETMINPDDCSNPFAYIVSVTQSRFNDLPEPGTGFSVNAGGDPNFPVRDFTGAGTLINMLGNTNHGGEPTFPVNMTIEELSPLRINAIPVEFRVEGCLQGLPVIRWLAF